MAKAEKSAMVNTGLQHFAQALFGIDGFVNTALYVPQMIKTWKIPQGTSLSTWGFWTLTSADGVFYAVVAARNLELALVLGGNLIGCSIIFMLAFTRKNRMATIPEPVCREEIPSS